MHVTVMDLEPFQADSPLEARWAPMLRNLLPLWSLPGHAETLNTPLEQAIARMVLGRPMHPDEDGCLPLTAWSRGDEGAWGTLTPCHGLVGSDRITGLPPEALALDEAQSRALFGAIEPLFASEGVELLWHSTLSWHVRHESLRGLPCASLRRMVGDSMQRWQAQTPLARSRLLRRLQNEAQMVLHAHPVNEARAAQRALVVNSLWLWGAGASDQLEGGPAAAEAQQRWNAIEFLESPDPLQALEAWLGNGAESLPDDSLLVLCGRSQSQAFTRRGSTAHKGLKPSSTIERWWRTLLQGSGLRTSPRRSRGEPSESITHWLAVLHEGHAPGSLS